MSLTPLSILLIGLIPVIVAFVALKYFRKNSAFIIGSLLIIISLIVIFGQGIETTLTRDLRREGALIRGFASKPGGTFVFLVIGAIILFYAAYARLYPGKANPLDKYITVIPQNMKTITVAIAVIAAILAIIIWATTTEFTF
jgi:hypothetical protein